MTAMPTIQKVDQRDPRVMAAVDAERRLYDYYDLEYKAHYIDLENLDIRIRALEVGSGPPLFLVPGGPGESFHFVPLMAQLKGWRILTFDRPGAAMSDAVDHREVDLRRFAVETLIAVMDYFELEEAPVVASSMGGLWSLWLALDEPARISKLVQFSCPALILGTSAPLPMRAMAVPFVNKLVFQLSLADRPEKARGVLKMLGCTDEAAGAMPEVFLETMYRMSNLPNHRLAWLSLMETVLRPRGAEPRFQLLPADLSRIKQPVKFIWGDGDVFGSVDVGRRAANKIPNAEIDVVSGSHVPFVDNTAECARLANDYLHRDDKLRTANSLESVRLVG
jgi:2-hydroxy-6-oxonona-2,4-dienedioate hydrolase